MKAYRNFIIVFALLLIVYIVIKANTPDPIRWEETLRSDDKNPYGAYILNNSHADLFPSTNVQYSREEMYDVFLSKKSDRNSAYCVIAPEIRMDSSEMLSLLDYVKKGNTVLLSAERIIGNVFDTLGLHCSDVMFDRPITMNVAMVDSSKSFLTNSAFHKTGGYSCRTITMDNYFDTIKKIYPIDTLGMSGKEVPHPDFVRVHIGAGNLLIHLNPLVFSNYFVIRQPNENYVAGVLSYIPKNVHNIIWDKYYTEGKEEPTTPFRFLLSNVWMRTGLYLSLILLLLYAFFMGKRRQRVIPVVAAPKNTTMEYVKTLSLLYFNKQSDRSIGKKKMLFWLAYIKNNYFIDTSVRDKQFVESLSKKSGVDATVIGTIVRLEPREDAFFSDRELQQLNNNLYIFYKQTKL